MVFNFLDRYIYRPLFCCFIVFCSYFFVQAPLGNNQRNFCPNLSLTSHLRRPLKNKRSKTVGKPARRWLEDVQLRRAAVNRTAMRRLLRHSQGMKQDFFSRLFNSLVVDPDPQVFGIFGPFPINYQVRDKGFLFKYLVNISIQVLYVPYLCTY